MLLMLSNCCFAQDKLDGIVSLHFNSQGDLERIIKAEKAENHNVKQVKFYQPIIQQDNWRITAKTAIFDQNANTLVLTGEVTILDNTDQTFQLCTNKLNYDPVQQLFTTTEHVYFKKNHLVSTGEGLKASLVNQSIEILHNLQTSIELAS